MSRFGVGCWLGLDAVVREVKWEEEVWGGVKDVVGRRDSDTGLLALPSAAVHRGCHPPALLLPQHLCMAPGAGPAPLPNAG